MKIGDRVKTKLPFLSNGEIIDSINYLDDGKVFLYRVLLDEKAPNEYAYNTNIVVLNPDELARE